MRFYSTLLLAINAVSAFASPLVVTKTKIGTSTSTLTSESTVTELHSYTTTETYPSTDVEGQVLTIPSTATLLQTILLQEYVVTTVTSTQSAEYYYDIPTTYTTVEPTTIFNEIDLPQGGAVMTTSTVTNTVQVTDDYYETITVDGNPTTNHILTTHEELQTVVSSDYVNVITSTKTTFIPISTSLATKVLTSTWTSTSDGFNVATLTSVGLTEVESVTTSIYPTSRAIFSMEPTTIITQRVVTGVSTDVITEEFTSEVLVTYTSLETVTESTSDSSVSSSSAVSSSFIVASLTSSSSVASEFVSSSLTMASSAIAAASFVSKASDASTSSVDASSVSLPASRSVYSSFISSPPASAVTQSSSSSSRPEIDISSNKGANVVSQPVSSTDIYVTDSHSHSLSTASIIENISSSYSNSYTNSAVGLSVSSSSAIRATSSGNTNGTSSIEAGATSKSHESMKHYNSTSLETLATTSVTRFDVPTMSDPTVGYNGTDAGSTVINTVITTVIDSHTLTTTMCDETSHAKAPAITTRTYVSNGVTIITTICVDIQEQSSPDIYSTKAVTSNGSIVTSVVCSGSCERHEYRSNGDASTDSTHTSQHPVAVRSNSIASSTHKLTNYDGSANLNKPSVISFVMFFISLFLF